MAKDFVDKYERFLPKVPEVVLPDLSAERFWKQIQRRNAHKAGGFDGWRTTEVRELPCALISWFVRIFRQIELGYQLPAAVLQ
eukprot:14580123-Alexandrium_andersonii.AAC.1